MTERGPSQANEDHNLYTFDMRKLQRALKVHKDHVSAVCVALPDR